MKTNFPVFICIIWTGHKGVRAFLIPIQMPSKDHFHLAFGNHQSIHSIQEAHIPAIHFPPNISLFLPQTSFPPPHFYSALKFPFSLGKLPATSSILPLGKSPEGLSPHPNSKLSHIQNCLIGGGGHNRRIICKNFNSTFQSSHPDDSSQ